MWQANVSLGEKTSFKIGARARHFAHVTSADQLLAAITKVQTPATKIHFFGSFTNVLLPDDDLDWVIQLGSGQTLTPPTNQGEFSVWAGEPMAKVAHYLLRLGWGGLSSFASLPGSVGGAVWNNAHFSDHFISDVLTQAHCLNLETKEVVVLPSSELNLGYDRSIFQTQPLIILDATFTLTHSNPQQEQAIAKKALAIRQQTQPLGEPSAGCFWQNVTNNDHLRQLFPQFAHQDFISAGFLIDQAGLKGYHVGDAQVSTKHAAFIINRGHATSHDVIELATHLKNTIQDKFGITLTSEVKIIKPT